VPLPPDLRLRLSPALRAVDLQLRVDAPVVPSADTPHALSVNPHGTTLSLLIAVTVILTFWSARTLFAAGGVRLAARAVAGMGLALAAFGIVQHTTAPHSFYWTTVPRQGTPFGPYLNHSDFAMWLVMALLLTSGYLIAVSTRSTHRPAGSASRPTRSTTARWLTPPRRRWPRRSSWGVPLRLMPRCRIRNAVGVVECRMERVAAPGCWRLRRDHGVAAFANPTALAGQSGKRSANWRPHGDLAGDLPMAKDFWLIGIGAGAFERGMVVYQRHRTRRFSTTRTATISRCSQACCCVPAIAAAVVGISSIGTGCEAIDRPCWVARGRERLVAVAVQSIWETGLRCRPTRFCSQSSPPFRFCRPIDRP
jgi:hypothetical protein